jgi:hypothetical protein
MFGSMAGQRVDIPTSTLLDMAVAAPIDTDNYEATLVAADQVG